MTVSRHVERYWSDPEKYRAQRRDYMRRRRADPEKRAKDNAAKNAKWATHYGPPAKARLHEVKTKHFFVWRSWIVNRYGERVTAHQLASLWRLQRGRCALTGRKLNRSAQIDHIVPRKAGGNNSIDNLRWVSPEANRAKADLTDAEFLDLCRNVSEWIGVRLARAVMEVGEQAA